MDKDQKFWLSVWALVAVSLLVFLAMVTRMAMYSDELIAKSMNPLEVACALSGNQTSHSCIALLGKK